MSRKFLSFQSRPLFRKGSGYIKLGGMCTQVVYPFNGGKLPGVPIHLKTELNCNTIPKKSTTHMHARTHAKTYKIVK